MSFGAGVLILKATPHNSRRTACLFLFRQLAQIISARLTDSGDNNAVMRNFTRQMLKDFIRE